MKTTDLIDNLTEWRDSLKEEQHPITLTLNAAITQLSDLHFLAAQMLAFTTQRPEELEPYRDGLKKWESLIEKATGTTAFEAITKFPLLTDEFFKRDINPGELLSAALALVRKMRKAHDSEEYQNLIRASFSQLGHYEGPEYGDELRVLTEVIARHIESQPENEA